jgi:hypothetical protein
VSALSSAANVIQQHANRSDRAMSKCFFTLKPTVEVSDGE